MDGYTLPPFPKAVSREAIVGKKYLAFSPTFQETEYWTRWDFGLIQQILSSEDSVSRFMPLQLFGPSSSTFPGQGWCSSVQPAINLESSARFQ